jgi:hypothetical protein
MKVFGFASRNVKFCPNVRKAKRRTEEPKRIIVAAKIVWGVQVKIEGLRNEEFGQSSGGGEG